MTQVGQEVVTGMGVVPAAFSRSAAARTCAQVRGGSAAGTPAFSRASRLTHMTAEEELCGMETSRPCVSL